MRVAELPTDVWAAWAVALNNGIGGGQRGVIDYLRDISEQLVKYIVRGDRSRSPGIFKSLDVNAIYIFEGVLGERNGLTLASQAEIRQRSIYLTKLNGYATWTRINSPQWQTPPPWDQPLRGPQGASGV